MHAQLAHQLLQLPEVWWYQDPHQPNCALSQCWGSLEPQKAREVRAIRRARRCACVFLSVWVGMEWNGAGAQRCALNQL